MLRTKTHFFAKVLLFTYRSNALCAPKPIDICSRLGVLPASIAATSDFDAYFERLTLCRNNFDIPHCLN